MTLLVACGLRREARIIAREGVTVVAGGGDASRLEAALEAAAGDAWAILSSGLAGALDPVLGAGDVAIGAEHGALPETIARLLPNAHVGEIIGGEAIAVTPRQKSELYARTGAIAVDMESHIAARVAARHGLPFAILRTISDKADQELPSAALVGMRPDGGMALGAVFASLARHPTQLPALVRTGIGAELGFRALRRCYDVLGRGGIGFADLRELALDMR